MTRATQSHTGMSDCKPKHKRKVMIDSKSFTKSFLHSMRLFTLTFAAGMVAFSIQAKTIQLTMQHMEQPPSRVEAMQVVVDKFNEKYPQYRMKQNVVGWGEAYSRVTAQVEAGVIRSPISTNTSSIKPSNGDVIIILFNSF